MKERILAKRFVLMTSNMYSKREYRELRKYILKPVPKMVYIWF